MAQTFNTILSFVKSISRKDRRKGVGSLSVSAVAGGGVGSAADSATQAWVRDNFVDKTTEQEISALKIFSQGIKIGDVSLFKHPDGYVYLDETLVLKGGVVMYANGSGGSVPSIFDSLPIDGRTIKRDGNGALYVDETALSISGGGGGVADYVHWNNVTGKPSWIGSTKPSYKYSEIEEQPDLSVYAKLTDIPSLDGYATQSWVENKGYLLAATASNTYQPKITTTNKLAYSLISGTPDLSVYALNTDIPTKLSQFTDDVVAGNYLPLSGGTISSAAQVPLNIKSTNKDLNVIVFSSVDTDLSYIGYSHNAQMTRLYDYPSSSYIGITAGKAMFNTSEILHAGNYSDYALPLSGGTLISAGVTTLNLRDTARNESSIGYAGNGGAQWFVGKGVGVRGGAEHFGFYNHTKGLVANFDINGNLTATKFVGPLQGNADSATKLATARTIWGQSFDGSGDVSGTLHYVNNIYPNSEGERYIGTSSNPFKYMYAEWYGAGTGKPLSFGANNGCHIFVNTSGNVTIGGSDLAGKRAKLYVNGIAYAKEYRSLLNENGVIWIWGGGAVTGDEARFCITNSKTFAANIIIDATTGNVAIGGTKADAKLHVHGTAKFTDDTTFSSKVVIGTIPVYESVDGTLFVDANVVFRGGVAMYGNTTTTTINEE